ncbi:MAG: translation elongation factor Ts [Acidobacteriia bacterium]|nr:translation elongation factor Ts [Terriglobia bacterium]
MAEITAALVKDLRDRTGAGMMECKKALVESKGDIGDAEVLLRKWGIASAGKKASRVTRQGLIGSYIHHGGQLGVLVEVNCESDFVARTDAFKELVHDVAMHIAAADPRYIRKEDVPAEVLDKEKDIARARALGEGKPEKILDKIVEGRINKFYEEVCLLDQPFVKEATLTVGQLVKTKIALLKENIGISRFTRFKVGDVAAMEAGHENPPE